jgi:hypothetical protein
MSDPAFQAAYGNLYRLYRDHAYWFECVILTQTIVLVAISVFASQIGSYTSVLITGLHLAAALQLLQFVRPYASILLHRIHVALLCCLLLNVFAALLMFAQPVRAAVSRSFAIGQAVVAASALAFSACFIVSCCVLIGMCVFRGPSGARVQAILARWLGKRLPQRAIV